MMMRSTPALSVCIEIGQVPQAPTRVTCTTPSSSRLSNTMSPPSLCRAGRMSSIASSTRPSSSAGSSSVSIGIRELPSQAYLGATPPVSQAFPLFRFSGSIFGGGLDPLERGQHVPPVGAAPGRAEQLPVELEGQVLGEVVELGDVGPAVGGRQPVAPGHRVVLRRADHPGELLAGIARHHGALGPVGGTTPVALHVAPEAGADLGPGRALDPL